MLKGIFRFLDTITFDSLAHLCYTLSRTSEPLAQSAEHLPFKQGVARSSRARLIWYNMQGLKPPETTISSVSGGFVLWRRQIATT